MMEAAGDWKRISLIKSLLDSHVKLCDNDVVEKLQKILMECSFAADELARFYIIRPTKDLQQKMPLISVKAHNIEFVNTDAYFAQYLLKVLCFTIEFNKFIWKSGSLLIGGGEGLVMLMLPKTPPNPQVVLDVMKLDLCLRALQE